MTTYTDPLPMIIQHLATALPGVHVTAVLGAGPYRPQPPAVFVTVVEGTPMPANQPIRGWSDWSISVTVFATGDDAARALAWQVNDALHEMDTWGDSQVNRVRDESLPVRGSSELPATAGALYVYDSIYTVVTAPAVRN